MKFFKAPRYVMRKHNILRFLKNTEFDSFLDIGCGAGELACSIAKNGKNGIGVDFSKDAVRTANSIAEEYGVSNNVRFRVGDGFKDTSGKFNLVICCEVLEHIKDDRLFLNKIISKSNKYILISVPAKMKLYDNSDKSVGHYRRYEKSNLINLLKDSHLEIINFINYGYPLTGMVRILRKTMFNTRLKTKNGSEPEKLSKDSGINPVKPPKWAKSIDLENILKPFYWFSLIFNKTNLGEGYLVLCKVKE